MPRYSRYGGLDSQPVMDGDSSFNRLNMRLRPSQLNPGEVAVSENGRMDIDQVWRVRDGYQSKSGVLVTEESVPILRVEDGAAALTLIANVNATAATVSNVCTVTTASAHGLPSGHTSVVNLASFTAAGTGTDINGNRTVTWASTTTFTFSITSDDDTYTGGTAGSFKLSTTVAGIYGSCRFSDPTNSNAEYLLIATNASVLAYDVATFSETAIAYPASTTINEDCDLVQAFDKVYLFREGYTPLEWDGDLTGSPAFSKVASGAKTQQTILQSSNNTTISSGVATVSETGHGLEVGDKFFAIEAAGLEVDPDDQITVATVPDANSFTYYVDAADYTGTVVYTTRGSDLGGGYINMPAAGWGVYHQRRFWLPYTHDAAASPSARNVQDELIASDLLDPTTFDPVANQFRVTAGVSDYLVAAQPFNEDTLLAFNRNSIHVLRNVSGALGDVQTQVLSEDVGCLARKSIVAYANQVFFLSDSGVYSVSFQDEYNLRGTELPLSEAIQPLINRINTSAADKAVAVYHNNRYYLAVPLDGSTVNNALLVYNFLNQGWESYDYVSASGFSILDLIPARSGKVNELYGVTTAGGVHKLEATGLAQDSLAVTIGGTAAESFSIPATVTTRQYVAGTMDRKKWREVEVQLKSPTTEATNASIAVVTEDPDNTGDLGTIYEALAGNLVAGEDASIRKRTGNLRGYGLSVTMTPSEGRPKLRAVRVDGSVAFRSNTSTQ
jgi:hypothetical protein